MICSRETTGAAIEAELENQYYVGDEDARMIIQRHYSFASTFCRIKTPLMDTFNLTV